MFSAATVIQASVIEGNKKKNPLQSTLKFNGPASVNLFYAFNNGRKKIPVSSLIIIPQKRRTVQEIVSTALVPGSPTLSSYRPPV